MESNAITPEILTLGYDLLAFKRYYVGLASLLAYDYCLVFERELKYIWKGQRSLMFYLYLMNRYIPVCFSIITLSAYFSPLWTSEVCNRFAIVKWFETLLTVIPAESVLVVRTFALTGHNRWVAMFLSSIMFVQCFVVIYAMSQPGKNQALQTPSTLADPYHVCILFSDPKMDTAYLGVSILFDFIVFAVTILRTVTFTHSLVPKTTLMRTIVRDGVLYFAIILSGNIIWMACALTGRPGIRLINAQPSMILTSIMITRLTLSLRRAGQEEVTVTSTRGWMERDGFETVDPVSKLQVNSSTYATQFNTIQTQSTVEIEMGPINRNGP
ncbi:hypothetical protein BDN70DRAFT_883735 [Pholiota conissans]|uniref:DUF6533 domain-containing protein n=1 Tax=Pholiota conissans TaxID=109636 RepID=A0A9P5YWW9_9AGAR|nr:hypothetical protein BDN70DRAFT_883735 [Pholiota conissans]